jgi:hypothetical protein
MRLVVRPIFKLVASRLTRNGETIIVAICGAIVPRLPVSANAKGLAYIARFFGVSHLFGHIIAKE